MAVDFTPESSPGAFYQYTSPSSACFPSVLEPDLSFFSTHHQPNYPRSSLPDFGHLRGACSPHRPIPRNSRHHKHLATPTNNHNTPPRFTWDSLGPSTPPVDLTTSSPVEHSPRQSTDYLFESLSPEARFLEEACASCITPDAGTSHQRPPTMGRRRRSLSSQPRASSSQTPQSRPAKRRRTGESPSRCPGSSFDTHPPPEVESIDLTQVEDKSALADALSKQREDAVRAQMNNASGGDEAGRSSLTSYKCPVCMDVLENATSTICGHLFCHKCIIDTLRFGEERQKNEGISKPKGKCPVCRKAIGRSEKGRPQALIPMELKFVTKSQLKGKEKAQDEEGSSLRWEDLCNWDQ